MSLDKLRRLYEAATPFDELNFVNIHKYHELQSYLTKRAEAIIALIEAADAVDSDWNFDTGKALREALKSFKDES